MVRDSGSYLNILFELAFSDVAWSEEGGKQEMPTCYYQVKVEHQNPHLVSLTPGVGGVLLISAERMGVPAPHTDSVCGGTLLAGGGECPGSFFSLL